MKLLVLGGTKFLGRAVVDAARARGHELTLFNRGQQDPRRLSRRSSRSAATARRAERASPPCAAAASTR